MEKEMKYKERKKNGELEFWCNETDGQ